MQLPISYKTQEDVIYEFWSGFIGYNPEESYTQRITIVPHKKGDDGNSKDFELSDTEIYVIEWKNGWIIVSVPTFLLEKVLNTLTQESTSIEDDISKVIVISRKVWPVKALYLEENYIPLENSLGSIRKLSEKDDYVFYQNFMDSCDKHDIDMVSMDFENELHVFFALFENGKIISIWNYQREDEFDKIAHIWILTIKEKQGKWYAKKVVQALLNDAISNGLVPQWRVLSTNSSSLRLAAKFWFQEKLQTYSLFI